MRGPLVLRTLVYRTGMATTDGQLAALWRDSGLGGGAPAVDWRTEIAVWFGAVDSSGCPASLDGAMADGATLHGQLVVRVCCTDRRRLSVQRTPSHRRRPR